MGLLSWTGDMCSVYSPRGCVLGVVSCCCSDRSVARCSWLHGRQSHLHWHGKHLVRSKAVLFMQYSLYRCVTLTFRVVLSTDKLRQKVPTGRLPCSMCKSLCVCLASRPDRLRDIADRFNLDQEAVLDNILYARAYTSRLINTSWLIHYIHVRLLHTMTERICTRLKYR